MQPPQNYQQQVPVYQNIPPQPYPQVQYSQPVVIPAPVTTPAIIINQPVMYQNIKVTSRPLNTFCPFCKSPIVTVIRPETNLTAWCCCLWSCGIIFACIQMAKNKEMSCYDYTHTCPQCGSIIGKYYAM